MNQDNEHPLREEAAVELARLRADRSQLDQTIAELRADRERLLRLIEEQVSTAKLFAAKRNPNTPVLWFLISMSLLLVVVLLFAALLYLYQTAPVTDEGETSLTAGATLMI